MFSIQKQAMAMGTCCAGIYNIPRLGLPLQSNGAYNVVIQFPEHSMQLSDMGAWTQN